MKKLMNHPDTFLEESLAGVLAAYPEYLQAHPDDRRAIWRADRTVPDKVTLITGGGFGHIPLFLGYVGEGLCDGVAVGNVFSTPGQNTVYRLTESLPSQNGVLYIIGNYLGDHLHFDMAAERASANGIRTRQVLISDDVSTAPRSEWRNRRGIGGIVFVYKIIGAAARNGLSLDALVLLAERVNENMASYGIAFSPCQLPGTSSPIYSIGEDEMELGIGIHGEPGVKRSAMMSSREIARLSVGLLVEDLSLQAGERVAVMINGLGATSGEEQFIFYRDVHSELLARGIQPARRLVGRYATSLEMGGVSVTMLRVDDELLRYISEPAHSPFVSFL